jgi:hypothetical protein
MENNRFGKLMITAKDSKCFYHVLGDYKEYYDLTSIDLEHPELHDFIQKQKYTIEMAFFRKKKLNIDEKY